MVNDLSAICANCPGWVRGIQFITILYKQIQKTSRQSQDQYLKYFGLVVGQPFLDGAQEVKRLAATSTVRMMRVIFFIDSV